jgi:carbamoyltransferase
VIRLGHHYAHAATAFLTAPVDEAIVLICDGNSNPPVTVWRGQNGELENLHWRWTGPGFATLYSLCAELLGLGIDQPHRLEALARLGGDTEWPELSSCFAYSHGEFHVDSDWPVRVNRCLNGFDIRTNLEPGIHVASALQRAVGRQLLALAEEIYAVTPAATLCLGGGLFYNTYFNTLLSRFGPFKTTFVAPNPGNAGIAAGAALTVGRRGRSGRQTAVSPFLGPEYDHETIKAALDNCKLSYECLSQSETIAITVKHLMNGRLIGWFNGRMEWGHRSLGNRSILANPTSAYVLDNLNCFLKQGAPYRTYGLSVCEDDLDQLFSGPPISQWMEYEYTLRDPRWFRPVLPMACQRLRVQTIKRGTDPLYELHKAFARAGGTGALINTSFNGFSEPIVCSPRDAIRVFFGTGLDVLVLNNRFVLTK